MLRKRNNLSQKGSPYARFVKRDDGRKKNLKLTDPFPWLIATLFIFYPRYCGKNLTNFESSSYFFSFICFASTGRMLNPQHIFGLAGIISWPTTRNCVVFFMSVRKIFILEEWIVKKYRALIVFNLDWTM